jgi:tRNA (mo5U34)-methyltransferase
MNNFLSKLGLALKPKVADDDLSAVASAAERFGKDFEKAKERAAGPDFAWYPYTSLANFALFNQFLKGEFRSLDKLIGGSAVLDIGCADGATSFFLASLGWEVDAVDYGPTNFNNMQGVRALHEAFNLPVTVYSVNLDAQFALPRKNYGLALFLGILYHLKNPFFAMERLAESARYCLLSTRVTKFDRSKQVSLENVPVAYLVAPDETNNDSTNYWIFSKAGLERLLNRSGWDVCAYQHFGNTVDSDPASAEGDERAFCLLKSRIYKSGDAVAE